MRLLRSTLDFRRLGQRLQSLGSGVVAAGSQDLVRGSQGSAAAAAGVEDVEDSAGNGKEALVDPVVVEAESAGFGEGFVEFFCWAGVF